MLNVMIPVILDKDSIQRDSNNRIAKRQYEKAILLRKRHDYKFNILNIYY